MLIHRARNFLYILTECHRSTDQGNEGYTQPDVAEATSLSCVHRPTLLSHVERYAVSLRRGSPGSEPASQQTVTRSLPAENQLNQPFVRCSCSSSQASVLWSRPVVERRSLHGEHPPKDLSVRRQHGAQVFGAKEKSVKRTKSHSCVGHIATRTITQNTLIQPSTPHR